jgi:hypothetical protein
MIKVDKTLHDREILYAFKFFDHDKNGLIS